MKLKRIIFLIFSLFLLLFTACEGEEEEDGSPSTTSSTTKEYTCTVFNNTLLDFNIVEAGYSTEWWTGNDNVKALSYKLGENRNLTIKPGESEVIVIKATSTPYGISISGYLIDGSVVTYPFAGTIDNSKITKFESKVNYSLYKYTKGMLFNLVKASDDSYVLCMVE